VVLEEGHNDVAKNRLTNFFGFNKLILFTMEVHFNAEVGGAVLQ
jgi:hypothetical protein